MYLVITGVQHCDQPVAFIRMIREVRGLGLKDAHDAFTKLLDGAEIRIGPMDSETARGLKNEFAALGGVCELRVLCASTGDSALTVENKKPPSEMPGGS